MYYKRPKNTQQPLLIPVHLAIVIHRLKTSFYTSYSSEPLPAVDIQCSLLVYASVSTLQIKSREQGGEDTALLNLTKDDKPKLIFHPKIFVIF